MKDDKISVALNGMLLGGNFSGVEEAILGLARELATGGKHRYRFFVPDSCKRADLSGPMFETERVDIPNSRLIRLLWEQRRLPAILKEGGYDLLHAPAYLAPLSTDIPVVLTVYDLQALLFPKMCRPLNRLNYRLMLPRSIRMASGIIVPSQSVADDLVRLFPEARDKIEVIPLGVNPAFRVLDQDEQDAILEGLCLPKPFIFFAGNMAPNKNLITLVHAFGVMKRNHQIPHKLVLAGRKAWEYQKISRCIREEGLRKEVICVDYVSERELAGLYNAADIFVFPSLYEGFGLPPLEAMSCGTPVICSGMGGLKETVGDAALLVEPNDPKAISHAMAGLIKDRAMQNELKEKGIEHAKAFSWENARLQTEAFYEKILSSL